MALLINERSLSLTLRYRMKIIDHTLSKNLNFTIMRSKSQSDLDLKFFSSLLAKIRRKFH